MTPAVPRPLLTPVTCTRCPGSNTSDTFTSLPTAGGSPSPRRPPGYARPMCGRFMQERPVSELAEIFEAEPLVDEPGGRYNIAPTDEAIVVVERDARRALKGYRWG